MKTGRMRKAGVERARELFDRGKWEAALKELQAAIRVNPYNPLWNFDLGMVLDQLGRYDEAVVAFRRVLELERMTSNR